MEVRHTPNIHDYMLQVCQRPAIRDRAGDAHWLYAGHLQEACLPTLSCAGCAGVLQAPMHYSNVMLVDPLSKKPVRTYFLYEDQWPYSRVCGACCGTGRRQQVLSMSCPMPLLKLCSQQSPCAAAVACTGLRLRTNQDCKQNVADFSCSSNKQCWHIQVESW